MQCEFSKILLCYFPLFLITSQYCKALGMHLPSFQHLVCFLFNQDFMINFVFVLEDLIQGLNLDWPLHPVPTTHHTIAALHMTPGLKNVVNIGCKMTPLGKANMPYHFPCFGGSVASPCIKAGVSSKTSTFCAYGSSSWDLDPLEVSTYFYVFCSFLLLYIYHHSSVSPPGFSLLNITTVALVDQK